MAYYNVKPIALNFKVSRLLVSVLSIAGAGACAIVLCMPFSIALKLFICALVLLATGYHLGDKGFMLMPWSCTGIKLIAKGELIVSTRAGNEFEINVQTSSFVASYMTILNYRVRGKFWQQSSVLLPDNTDADEFRQLRVWLRWARHPSLITET